MWQYNNWIFFVWKIFRGTDLLFQSKSTNKIYLQDTYGDNHCVLKLVDSLSKRIKFCIGFSSETHSSKLNLIVLGQYDKLIIEVDKFLYFISLSKGDVISKIELFTPLIGLHHKKEKLLVLEEAELKVIDINGIVNKEEFFDLIEDFTFVDNTLYLTTIEGEKKRLKFRKKHVVNIY